MYLSDADLLRLIDAKEIEITPFKGSSLTPNGYDLSVVPIDKDGKEVGSSKALVLKSGEFAKIKSMETVHISNGYIAHMFLRSRYTRAGLLGIFAVVDGGFNGKIYASLKNLSDDEISVNLGEGAIHIIFAKTESKSLHPYGSTEKSHFQNQK